MPRKPKPAPNPALPDDSFTQWESRLSPRERRIEDIVGKMMAGAWLSGVSDHTLAKEWNLSPNTVRKMAAEASRAVRFRLREDPGAKEDARAMLLQTFEVIRAKAMAKGDAPSLRVALDASRAFGFYLGIEPAKQLDVTQRKDDFAGWSTEEKIEYSQTGRKPRRAMSKMLGGDDTEGGVH
jgi:hypothetical protein